MKYVFTLSTGETVTIGPLSDKNLDKALAARWLEADGAHINMAQVVHIRPVEQI